MDEAYFKLAVWLNDKGLCEFFPFKLNEYRKKCNFPLHFTYICIIIDFFSVNWTEILTTQMQKIIGFNRNMKIIWLQRWHYFSLWTLFYRCFTLPFICVIRINWKSNWLVNENLVLKRLNPHSFSLYTSLSPSYRFRSVNISANYRKFAWVCVSILYGTIEIGKVELCYVGCTESHSRDEQTNRRWR